MTWLVLGLAATALGSLVGTVDKAVVERHRETPWIYAYLMSFFLCLYSILLLIVRSQLGLMEWASGPVVLIALLPGLIHFINAMLYTQALLWTDAATAQAVGQLRPVFSLVWGILIFQEFLAPAGYAGVLVIVFCCILLSIEQNADSGRRFRFGRSVKYLLLAAFLSSLSDVSTKWALSDLSYWDTFILNRLGALPPVLLLFYWPPTGEIIRSTVRKQGPRFLLLIGLIEVGAMLALFLTVMAFSRGPLALVSATLATTPLFVLGYTALLRRLKSSLAPPLTEATPTILRWTLLLGIVGGVYFMSVDG